VSAWGRDARDRRSFITTPIRDGAAVESPIDPAVERRRQEAEVTFDRFVWARSGRHLLFEGRAQGTQSLWRVTVDPATLAWIDGPDRLTTGTTQDTDAVLSPDGGRVVFSARSAKTRLWMFPFDAATGKLAGAGQPVTSGGAGEQDADVLDDGTKLVYRTLRGAKQQLWERTIADGRDRLLVDADAWTRTRPRWSPDGRWVAYLKRRTAPNGATGEAAVAIFSVDRREESVITRPSDPQFAPTDWSSDGRWLLGTSRTIGICTIEISEGTSPDARVRALTGDATHVLYEARFSPDQRWISFIAVNAADAGVSTIYIMPASGGPWQPVTDGSIYDDKPHWSPDGGTLYFVSHRDGVLNVWGRRIDSATGKPSGAIFQVTSFNSPRQMISPQLSQMQIALTGNRLFLPITDTQSELWMLENVDR
jgi:Tol biopolymer transport system component